MRITTKSSLTSKIVSASRRRPGLASDQKRVKIKPSSQGCKNYFRSAQAEEVARLIPNYDPWQLAGDCRFDVEVAASAVDFWHFALTFVKGERTGDPFMLEPWQQAIVGNTFGWIRPDGTRRYRQVFIAVARKNGKTPLAAGFGLRLFAGEVEPGAEILSVASTRDQARKVWEWAGGMIRACPALESMIRIYQHSMILNDDPLASYKPVAAEAGARHGDDLHGAIIDELHTLPSRDLVDVIETSTAARRQPLVVMITTAGWDQNSICWEKWQRAKAVCRGDIADSALLPVIYEADEKDDWTSEKVWRKANPNLGVSVKLDYLRAECAKARLVPAYENTFRQLHLNQWTEQAVRWISMRAWDACDGEMDVEALAGTPCIAGLDLASVRDTTALQLVFWSEDRTFRVLTHVFIPEEKARAKEETDRVPYRKWADEGWVTLTPGQTIDQTYVFNKFVGLSQTYEIEELVYDPWASHAFIARLTNEAGYPEEQCIQHRQGFVSMSEPSKAFEKAILENRLIHGGNPLLRAQVAGVKIRVDPAENIKPDKSNSNTRIDAVVATIMALGRANLRLGEDSHSDTGPIVFSW